MSQEPRQYVCFLAVVVATIIVLAIWSSGNRDFKLRGNKVPAAPMAPESVNVVPLTANSEPPAAPESVHAVPLTTKDLIVRSVYWDNRPRGGHKGASVFMVEVLKSELANKSIVGCKVGSFSTTTFKIRPLGNLGAS